MPIIVIIALVGLVLGGGVIGYNYATKSNYRQKMKKYPGYFDDLYLGEYFDVEYFSPDENAISAMNLNYTKKLNNAIVRKDDFGYFILLNQNIRIYLPKDEWFTQFYGVVKSFQDRESQSSELVNKFSIIFYLKYPTKSIGGPQLDKKGNYFIGPPTNNNDPSRGWDVLNLYKTSGYFSVEGNKLHRDLESSSNIKESKKIINEIGLSDEGYYDPYDPRNPRSSNVMAQRALEMEKKNLNNQLESLSNNPPSGLFEYSHYVYGSDYAKSDFDVWYDSSNGTAIVIGTQICAGIYFEWLGVLRFLSVPVEASLSAANLAKFSVIIAGEIIVGMPEVMYLYNRGYTSSAAIVAVCMLLPFITSTMVPVKILKLKPLDEYIYRDLAKASKEFRTPLQFKQWVEKLPTVEKQIFMERFAVFVGYYKRNSTEILQKELIKSFSDFIKSMKTLPSSNSIELMVKKYFVNRSMSKFGNIIKQLPKLSFNNYPILSNLGFTITSIGVLWVACILYIEDDEQKLKDRQNILDNGEKTLKFLSENNKNPYNIIKNGINFNNQKIKELTKKEVVTKSDLELALKYNYQNLVILENLNLFNSSKDLFGKKDFFLSESDENKKQAYDLLQKFKAAYMNDILFNLQEEIKKGNDAKLDENLAMLNKMKPNSDKAVNLLIENQYYDENKIMYPDSDGFKLVTENGETITINKKDADKFLLWFFGINLSEIEIENKNFNNSYFKSKSIGGFTIGRFNYVIYDKDKNNYIYDTRTYPLNIMSNLDFSKLFLNKDQYYLINCTTDWNSKRSIYKHLIIRYAIYNYYNIYLVESKKNILTTTTTTNILKTN